MKKKKGQGGNIKTWIMENNTLDGANKTLLRGWFWVESVFSGSSLLKCRMGIEQV